MQKRRSEYHVIGTSGNQRCQNQAFRSIEAALLISCLTESAEVERAFSTSKNILLDGYIHTTYNIRRIRLQILVIANDVLMLLMYSDKIILYITSLSWNCCPLGL